MLIVYYVYGMKGKNWSEEGQDPAFKKNKTMNTKSF